MNNQPSILKSPPEGNILLKAIGLSKSYGGQSLWSNVNFELKEGEVVLLQGENGSGKTTLLNVLTGNLEADKGKLQYFTNSKPFEFIFPIKWTKKLNPLDNFSPEFVSEKGISRTWQDIRLFNSLSLQENVAVAYKDQVGENPLFALIRSSKVKKQEKNKLKNSSTLLINFGLEHLIKKNADQISLGQSKRVAIARAVAAGAKILFMDEPLSGLDLQGISSLIEFLKSLVANEKLTVVIIEHFLNIPLLSSLITTDWHFEKGKMTISLVNFQNSKAQITTNAKSESIQDLHFLIPEGSQVKIDALPNNATLTRIRPFDFDSSKAEVVLEASNLQIKRSGHLIEWHNQNGVNGLDLKIYRGEVAVLQAPNGWGKTSFIETISGELPAFLGHIVFLGENLKNLRTWQRSRKGISIVSSSNNVFSNITAKEMLRLSGVTEIAQEISHLLQRQISELSGGEKQQVALACSQNKRLKHLVILDEPFSSLDKKSINLFKNLFLPDKNYATIIFLPAIHKNN